MDDPHSPVIHGLWKVLSLGTLLYSKAARDTELIKGYGVGITEDWMDTHFYTRHRFRGALIFLAIEILCWVGYRDTETKDDSRNFLPIGIIFCGAELHNNHHANPASAKLSMYWWEFDAGWLAIRVMALLRLVTINRVAKPHPAGAAEQAMLSRRHGLQ